MGEATKTFDAIIRVAKVMRADPPKALSASLMSTMLVPTMYKAVIQRTVVVHGGHFTWVMVSPKMKTPTAMD